jgi:uncharacterized protein YqeY
MITLSTIETDLTEAMKAKNQLKIDTLRGLKTRIQNDQIAKGRPLEDQELVALVRSEVKRRKEAAESFTTGGRSELAAKELQEVEILTVYLPAGPTEAELAQAIDSIVTPGATAADFGSFMGKLKAQFPNADGGELSRLLKAKLS